MSMVCDPSGRRKSDLCHRFDVSNGLWRWVLATGAFLNGEMMDLRARCKSNTKYAGFLTQCNPT